MSQSDFHFYLGGNDLEMQTIRALLLEHNLGPVFDKQLAWGASSTDYEREINQSLTTGATPVLIELDWNTPGLPKHKVILLNHHNEQAGANQPTPLQQLFELLALERKYWTRYYDLVVANDKAHIQGLLDEGATRQEIIAIRKADRAAQGVTEQDEAIAQQAITQKQTLAEGKLTLVYLQHNKSSAVADRLDPALGGAGCENLLVVSPNELNFYGQGKLVTLLAQKIQPSWYGGNLPHRGFWGCEQPQQKQQVQALLTSELSKDGKL